MFDLERYEKGIVIFLVTTLLIGLILVACNKFHSPAHIRIAKFDMAGDVPAPATEKHPKINLNTADADELAELKGIGKALAGRIVDHRSSAGCFVSASDIKNVKGIGPKLFERIKDDISVE